MTRFDPCKARQHPSWADVREAFLADSNVRAAYEQLTQAFALQQLETAAPKADREVSP
jgi:hypothetical protein